MSELVSVLDFIRPIMERGCPNCRQKEHLLRGRSVQENKALCTDWVKCTQCDITWETSPYPLDEIGWPNE